MQLGREPDSPFEALELLTKGKANLLSPNHDAAIIAWRWHFWLGRCLGWGDAPGNQVATQPNVS